MRQHKKLLRQSKQYGGADHSLPMSETANKYIDTHEGSSRVMIIHMHYIVKQPHNSIGGHSA